MEKITFTPAWNGGVFSPELSNGDLVEIHIEGRFPRIERTNIVAVETTEVDPENGPYSFVDYRVTLSNQISTVMLADALQNRPNLTFYKV